MFGIECVEEIAWFLSLASMSNMYESSLPPMVWLCQVTPPSVDFHAPAFTLKPVEASM